MLVIKERKLSALDAFLESSFDSRELLLFLEQHCGRSFIAELPSGSESRRSLSHNAVRLLERHGLINQDLITALITSRPYRASQLRQIAEHLDLPKIDETEVKTAVWRPVGMDDASPRLRWVESLEQQVLIRERALDDASRVAAEAEIDEFTRRLRSGPGASAGSVVAGARLERAIGAGNFGTVWRAKELGTGNIVATKLFNLDRLADGVMLWRFRRSIRAMALLGKSHGAPASVPRLIQVSHDTLAFSMTYRNGGTLEQIERRGWSLSTKLKVFAEICRAVEFAHHVGIIHRDIKPANVLLDGGMNPVLVDYDIADIRFVTQLSVARGGLGTPVFAAPEQLECADSADERSDIYSLGRLLHYLLLERSPGYQIERDPQLNNLRHLPSALVALVRRASQWDPQRRYPAVSAMLTELASCQTGMAAMRAHVLGAQRWLRGNAPALAVFCTISCSSLVLAVFQRDNARLQADLAESRAAKLRLVRDEQAAARISVEQLQHGLRQLSKLRDELASLGDQGARPSKVEKPDETRLRAVRLATEFDNVQRGLEDASTALARHQVVLEDVLAPSPEPALPQKGWIELVAGPGSRIRMERPTALVELPLPTKATAPPAVTAPSPVPGLRATPPVSRPRPTPKQDYRYRNFIGTVKREAQAKMDECFVSRFDAAQKPIRLDISIAKDGRLQTFESKPALGPVLRGCLQGHLKDLIFTSDREEDFVYVID